MDPYAGFLTPPLTQTIQVPDDAVTIERENWEPTFGGARDGDQPAWATASDPSFDVDGVPTEIPDWLSSPSGDLPELPEAEANALLDTAEGSWMDADASSVDSTIW